jgi:hypothetical protein
VRCDPVVLKGAIDYRNFNFFDRYRWLIDPENTRALARCWAEAAGEFWKVVRRVKAFNSLLPLIAPG